MTGLTPAHLLQVAALLLVMTLAGAVVLQNHNARVDRLAARTRAVREQRTGSTAEHGAQRGPGLLHLVGGFGKRVVRSGVLSAGTLRGLRRTLADAGLARESDLGLFVGCKLMLLVGLPLLCWFATTHFGLQPLWRNLLVVAAAAVGLLLPDFIIKQMRAQHRKRVETGLADALDMMIICTEAGMAIETAILRVSQELRFAHPATATELAATSNELQMTADPQVAFTNMGQRTSLEALRRLGTTVVQTIQYGSPLTQALRTLGEELRTEMINTYEERAARLPVMLTVPMILFILPALFLVIAGPAAIQVMSLQLR